MSTQFKYAGYTLIELLLYISMIGVLLTAVTMYFGTSIEARVKNESIREVDEQGAAALELIAQTVRNADAITLPAVAGNGPQLTLTVPTGALSPTIFDLSSGALRIKEGAAAAVPITNSKVTVSSLNFKNLSRPSTPGVVQVRFIVSRVNTANRNPYDYSKIFTTTIAIRP